MEIMEFTEFAIVFLVGACVGWHTVGLITSGLLRRRRRAADSHRSDE